MDSMPGSRASELAARQVEQIVSAAQAAAEQIRRDARLEHEDLRRRAQDEADELREAARQDCEKLLEKAHGQAMRLGADAQRGATALIEEARDEAARARAQTRRALEGRVAAAEKAAADVLEEARALSSGLQQLGRSLESHAERILTDVTAAHRRMQADLRVGLGEPGEPAETGSARAERDARREPKSAPAPKAVADSRGAETSGREAGSTGRSRRKPFDDLDVPAWTGRGG